MTFTSIFFGDVHMMYGITMLFFAARIGQGFTCALKYPASSFGSLFHAGFLFLYAFDISFKSAFSSFFSA